MQKEMLDKKNKVFTFILFLLPLGAMAQTVDLEKDSLLVNLPYGNVLNVLASQVPGFSISPVDNAEGNMSATMTLRGMNITPKSKSATDLMVNAPLVVVDGMLFTGSISEISTADIAKVEVLSDAQALYGSRGCNGAILITTRKGKDGAPQIRFKAGGSVSDWSRRPEGVNEDWTDYISRKGIGQQYDLSVSGASGRVNYYVSGDYTRQQGILLGDDFQKMGSLAKLEYRPLDWVLVGVRASYTDGRRWGQTPRLQYAFWMNEPSHKYSEVPGYEDWPELYPDNHTPNPLIGKGMDDSYLYTSRHVTYNNYSGAIYSKLEFPFAKGLSLQMSYDMQRQWRKEDVSNDPKMFVDTRVAFSMDNPSIYEGSMQWSDEYWKSHRGCFSSGLNYERAFGKHGLSAGISYSREQFGGMSESTFYHKATFDATGKPMYNSKNIGDELTVSGIAGRVGYDYSSRLSVSASVYREGYTENEESISYFNVGAAWVALPEKLKLRADYGFSGNDELPSIFKTAYAAMNRMDVGADWAFLDGRLTGSLDAYMNKSVFEQLLVGIGGVSVISNKCSISNKGVELAVRSVNVPGDGDRGLRWESSVLLAMNKNKVESLYGKEDIQDLANAVSFGYDMYYAQCTGYPLTVVYELPSIGSPSGSPNVYIGDGDPLFAINIGNTLSWKKASLWFNLRGMYGGKEHFLGYDSVNQEWVSRNFLKLSDLVLSYKLNDFASIYLSGTNLLTFSKWPALDPENGGTIAPAASSDKFQSMPTFRTMKLGVNLLF